MVTVRTNSGEISFKKTLSDKRRKRKSCLGYTVTNAQRMSRKTKTVRTLIWHQRAEIASLKTLLSFFFDSNFKGTNPCQIPSVLTYTANIN